MNQQANTTKEPLLLARATYHQTVNEVKTAAAEEARLSKIAYFRLHKTSFIALALCVILIVMNMLVKKNYPVLFHRDIFSTWYAIAGSALVLGLMAFGFRLFAMQFSYASAQAKAYDYNRATDKPFDIQFYADVIMVSTPQFEGSVYWGTVEIKHLGNYLTLAIDMHSNSKLSSYRKCLSTIYIPINELSNAEFILALAMSRTHTSDYRVMEAY